MIYLDYNATTPIDPRVADAIVPYLREIHGNPSSPHVAGREARAGVVRARNQVAAMLAASPGEIVFTSGGSEANNHALKGVAHALRDRPSRTIIISTVEHPAIHAPCDHLAECGVAIVRVPVDGHGMVDPDAVRRSLTPDTILISIMHANNEVGTIQPIAEIAAVAREAGVLMHTDAAQTVGKIPVDVAALGVDLLSIAGHKFYAPAGVGALYVREGLNIAPLIHGAGHEEGRRAGTEAVPAIVGLGAAAELVSEERRTDRGLWQKGTGTSPNRVADSASPGALGASPLLPQADSCERIRGLRDRLHGRLADVLGDRIVLNGHPTERLPNTLNLSFAGQIGVHVLEAFGDLCVSPGAACHSDAAEPSAVLAAMGVPTERALGAIRFSLGRPTTEAEVDRAAERVVKAIAG